jgi:hypothetical protein
LLLYSLLRLWQPLLQNQTFPLPST